MEKRFPLKNGTQVLIRPAEKSDAAAFAAHLRQAGGETNFLSFGAEDCPYTAESALALVERSKTDERMIFLLAYVGDVLAGELFISTAPRKRFQHVGELAISVLKDYWDLGIATLLMREALAIADDMIGFDSIHLDVDADNLTAQKLYRNFGFHEYARYARATLYDGGYHDLVYMSRYRSKEDIQ